MNKMKIKDYATMNPKYIIPREFNYISLESINGGKIQFTSFHTITDAPSRAKRVVKKGNYLFQTVRPYQNNNLIYSHDKDMVASTGYVVLEEKYNYLPYLKFLIETPKMQKIIIDLCTGSNYPAINSKTFGDIEILVPSLDKQKQIGNFLSNVDKLIESKREEIKLKEEYKKGIIQKIFNKEIRFKDEDDNYYPEWEEKKFNEVIIKTNTSNKAISKNKFISKGEFPIISQESEFINGYKNGLDDNIIGHPKIVFGDHTLILKYIDFPFYKGSDGTVILESPNNILKFMYYQILFMMPPSEGYKRHFSLIKNFDIFIPSFEEQLKISFFLSNIDLSLENSKKELEEQKKMKNKYLMKIFG